MLKKMKTWGLGLVALMGLGTNALADVTFEDGAFSGTFELSAFYSAIGIVVTAIAIVAAIRLAIRTFKRVS